MYGQLPFSGSGSSLTLNGPTVAGGTSFDIAIGADAKRVSLHVQQLSTNVTAFSAIPIIRLGTIGGIEATGYVETNYFGGNGSVSNFLNDSTGFVLNNFGDAVRPLTGSIILTLGDETNFIWNCIAICDAGNGSAAFTQTGGVKTLAGALTTVRFTTPGGAAVYDTGQVGWTVET